MQGSVASKEHSKSLLPVTHLRDKAVISLQPSNGYRVRRQMRLPLGWTATGSIRFGSNAPVGYRLHHPTAAQMIGDNLQRVTPTLDRRHLPAFGIACQSAIPSKDIPCEVAQSIFVPVAP